MTCALVKPTSGYRTFSRLVSLTVLPSICTSTDVSLATFAHHVLRRLVDAEPLERWRAELPTPSPLDELELGHDLGFDEMRGSRRRRARFERTLIDRQRFQFDVQLVQRPVGETRADLAGVDEL